ncbi:hypothetical protein Tco_1344016 [Tanacetum coccineum]
MFLCIRCLALFLLSRFGSLSHLKDAICLWSKDPNVIPRAVGWSKKSIFNRSDYGYLFVKVQNIVCVLNYSLLVPPKMNSDKLLSQLNLPCFQLETIIQVLARERKNEYGLLQFKDEFSRLGREFMNSLNILFEELSQPLYTDENLSNLKDRYAFGTQKNINRRTELYVPKRPRRMKMEEEKHLHISMPGKSKATVSWVKINKHRLNVNDPSLAELLRKVKPWVEDLSRSFHSLDTVWLTLDIQRFISQEGNIKCKFPWSDDYTVGRNFWLTLVCLDPTRKGWLSEEHIDLWVDYMWHGRPDNANWAMVKLLLCCRTLASCQVLNLRCQERREQMIEMQPFLHLSPVLAESYNLLKELQDYELEKSSPLVMVLSSSVLCSLSSSVKLFCVLLVKERLLGILGATKVFEKKGIDPTDYSIRFKLADHVPKQGGIFSDCGVWDFVDENMTDDMPVLDEVVFKIHKNGYFELDPLRYVNGSFSSVSAFTCDRDIFPSCLNWILSSIPENIWALFYCLPNTPLEKGLKLIHTDNDVLSFFVEAERRGKIHLMVEVADIGLVEDELNLLNKKDLGKNPVGSAIDVQEFHVKA